MTAEEIKNKLEAKKCPVHKRRPYVIVYNGKIEKIHSCCEPFLRKIRSDLEYIYEQMDKEQFLSATEPIQMTNEQYKRAAKRILYLQKIIQHAHQALADPNIRPITIFKCEIEEAQSAYERIARSANKANDSLLENRVEVIAEAERLKPLLSQALRDYNKMQLAQEKEKKRIERERNKILEQEREEKLQAKRRGLLNISETTGVYEDSLYLECLVRIKALKDEMAQKSLDLNDSSKPPQKIKSIVISRATNAYEKIERLYKDYTDVWKEKDEVLSNLKSLQAQIAEAIVSYRNRMRDLQKEQEREAREKRKEKERERKRKQAEKERLKKQEEKRRLSYIQKSMPDWQRAIETANRFADDYNANGRITNLSTEDLHKLLRGCTGMFDLLSPIGIARVQGILSDQHEFILAFVRAYDRIRRIYDICVQRIDMKKKSPRTRTNEKQRDNKREDAPFFRKMIRLYEDRLKPKDTWYENESRRIIINMHEDIMEYLNAYGRIVRGNLAKAEIVFEGEEDIDRWGYFGLSDKYLPFCLREISLSGDMITYHLYTFNCVPSMENYDYDEVITDRIILLNNRGIKTN